MVWILRQDQQSVTAASDFNALRRFRSQLLTISGSSARQEHGSSFSGMLLGVALAL